MGLNLSRNLLLENANNRFTIPEYKKSYVLEKSNEGCTKAKEVT